MSYDLKDLLIEHKQKIIIVSLIIVIIVLAIIAFFLGSVFKQKTAEQKPYTEFQSSNKDISLILPDSLEMDLVATNDYELLLNSNSDGNAIGISKAKKNPMYTFEQFINSDKETYISEFENVKNIEDTVKESINDTEYCKYSFETPESYNEVYWTERDDSYYIIDFACDTKSGASDLKGNIDEIMKSLTFVY